MKIPEGIEGFDKDQLYESLMNEEELVFNLLEVFFSEVTNELINLRDLFNKNEIKEVKVISHSIKGAAATVKLHKIMDVALSIESKAAEGNTDGMDELITELTDLFHSTKKAFDA